VAPSSSRRGHADVVVIERDLRYSPLAPKQNLLLAALDAETFASLLPHLELVSLPQHWVVCEAGDGMDFVYFPTSSIVSLLYELENGSSVEVAFTGNDGLVGIQVFMGGGTATSRAVVRNTGHGYRLPADLLKERFESCPLLRQPLLRYAQALIVQMAQTAVCHCHHRLEQQFNRLLLLTLDRLFSNELALTQDTMANLLGVRRESITATAGKLQAAGLIRYHRGRITVLNRPQLEARVCECYAVVKAELGRLFPQRSPVAHPVVTASQGHSDAAAMSASIPFDRIRRMAHPDRSSGLELRGCT
jgi:CRP-like cAMP-binding protein